MKPSWDEAPMGAEFIEMDGNGCWFWYVKEPRWDASHNSWRGGNAIKFAGESTPVSETLERRP